MKQRSISGPALLSAFVFAAALSATVGSCRKDQPQVTPGLVASEHILGTDFAQTNLVADDASFGAGRIDANLSNAWGMAISPSGTLYISANHTGLAVVYNGGGSQLRMPIGIPLHGVANGASPDGAIYNNTPNFIIPGTGRPAKVIFVTEDGIVAAWNSGDTTVTVADRSGANAVYKGADIARDGIANFIYVADFHNAKVDVFDQSFNYVSKSFNDPGIPPGFAPFNIKNIDGMLYITYAKQKLPDNHDDTSGLGNGYVDIFRPNGTFVKRFASQGTLNSPWGIAQAPEDFGAGRNAILISNFGDGRINVFDPNGTYDGQLQNKKVPVSIDGLWGIAFVDGDKEWFDHDRDRSGNSKLYFTAGPQKETFGLFGYLQRK
jgi:uncharacterized protein (TIGR03118 family)